MAEYTTNTLRTENKDCSQVTIWIVDPFGSIVKQLKKGECHIIDSDAIHTWWDDEWQVKLILFLDKSPEQYAVKTVVRNLKKTENEIESFTWKGAYRFHISFISLPDAVEVIHDSPRQCSEYSCKQNWKQIELLKVRIEIKCSLYPNIPRFKPLAFGFHDRLKAIKDTDFFLDFAICVDGYEVRANKTILALASPVFLAMFSHDFQESQTQRVHVNDMQVNTIRRFVDFLHTGKISSFNNMKDAVELLYVSEKYEVLDLKKVCLEYIHAVFSGHDSGPTSCKSPHEQAQIAPLS